MCIFPVSPATAPQQEADAEVNTEALNKSSQSSTSSTQAATPDTASASKEKEAATEKSKDSSSSVSTSRTRQCKEWTPLHCPRVSFWGHKGVSVKMGQPGHWWADCILAQLLSLVSGTLS